MKIGFNITALKSGHKTRGIGSYTRNLLDQLNKMDNLQVVEFEDINEISDVDLVHYPVFDLFKRTLPLKKKFPTVVTIHDIIPLIFVKHYPAGIIGSINLLQQKYSLRGVQAVITDSKASQNDIAKNLNIPLHKIFPIYLGVTDNFRAIKDQKKLKSIAEKYHLPNEFVLYIGSTNWNKNLSTLAKACVSSSRNLVLIGAGFDQRENLDHPELKSFKNFLAEFEGNSLIKTLGFIEENDLVSIINLAEIVLLPSLYEGFGLPILEAQACGVPVVTSKASSMPEVAGEGAILINPESVEEIKNAIDVLNSDSAKRKDLIKKGFENVAKFSWEKTAKETFKVYRSVLEKS